MLRQQVLAQLQAQQGGGSLPQHIKLQLPIQIQQTGTTSAQGGQVGQQVYKAKKFTYQYFIITGSCKIQHHSVQFYICSISDDTLCSLHRLGT